MPYIRGPASAILLRGKTRPSRPWGEVLRKVEEVGSRDQGPACAFDSKHRPINSAPASHVGSSARRTTAFMGDSVQTGSVLPASPVSPKAWQRQPPKSMVLRGQEMQGSRIQSVPRNASNAGERSQMARSGYSRTLQNVRPGMLSAAWQGRTLPLGVTLSDCRPQPLRQGLG